MSFDDLMQRPFRWPKADDRLFQVSARWDGNAVLAEHPHSRMVLMLTGCSSVRLGYAKGVMRWLDHWVADHPEQAAFADTLRALAREFRFEAIEQQLMQRHA